MDVATWSDASPTTKSGRVGFDYSTDVNSVSQQTKKGKLKNVADNYRSCGNKDDLLNLDPNEYPTHVLMDCEQVRLLRFSKTTATRYCLSKRFITSKQCFVFKQNIRRLSVSV